jgi:hypothetical protein
MSQQGSALRAEELTSKRLARISGKLSTDAVNELSIEKALRIYPINGQVSKHNEKVLQYFEGKWSVIHTIKAQDQLTDATQNLGN